MDAFVGLHTALYYTALVCWTSSSAWRTRRRLGPCWVAGRWWTSSVGRRRRRRGRCRRSTASGRRRSARTSTWRWSDSAVASVAAAWRTTGPCSRESVTHNRSVSVLFSISANNDDCSQNTAPAQPITHVTPHVTAWHCIDLLLSANRTPNHLSIYSAVICTK